MSKATASILLAACSLLTARCSLLAALAALALHCRPRRRATGGGAVGQTGGRHDDRWSELNTGPTEALDQGAQREHPEHLQHRVQNGSV